jgi:DNA repair ATPase RecN
MNLEERVKEVARMLGGEIVTRTALEHARALMER